MIKIFIKSLFIAFLTFILIINMALAFNAISRISPFTPLVGDTNDKYFGISSIITFFKSGFVDDYFITNVQIFLQRFSNDIRVNLVDKWVDFSNSGGVTDLFSFFRAIEIFFSNIFALLEIIGYIIVYVISNLLIIAWVIWKCFFLLGGYYVTPLQPFSYTGVLV